MVNFPPEWGADFTGMSNYLLGIWNQGKFTSYELRNVLGLNGDYSLRLYEILKMQYGKHESHSPVVYWKVTVDELREKLGIEPGKYELYGHFKSRILLFAQDELTEKTDLRFTFEEKKHGRAVNELWFTIKYNPSKEARQELLRQQAEARRFAETEKGREMIAQAKASLEGVKKSSQDQELFEKPLDFA